MGTPTIAFSKLVDKLQQPVSTRVNHVANDDEECSAPVEPAQIQDRLFSL